MGSMCSLSSVQMEALGGIHLNFGHFGCRAPARSASFKMFQMIWARFGIVESSPAAFSMAFLGWIHQEDAELQHWQLLSSLEEIDESASSCLEQLETWGALCDGQLCSENRWRNEDEAVDLGAIRYTVYPCMPYFQSKPCVRDGTFSWENWVRDATKDI